MWLSVWSGNLQVEAVNDDAVHDTNVLTGYWDQVSLNNINSTEFTNRHVPAARMRVPEAASPKSKTNHLLQNSTWASSHPLTSHCDTDTEAKTRIPPPIPNKLLQDRLIHIAVATIEASSDFLKIMGISSQKGANRGDSGQFWSLRFALILMSGYGHDTKTVFSHLQ